jgi:hypothetical protein
MKRLFFLVLLLSACGPSVRETSTTADSLKTVPYEDFSEVVPFTVKDEIRFQSIELNGQRKNVVDYLMRFYHPDPYVSHTGDSTNIPGYIITEVRVIEDNFFGDAGTSCRKRSILMTSRGDFIEKEYYDLLVVDENADGELAVVDKITFDGSEGQSSTIVTAEAVGLSTDPKCRVLKVLSSSEGGDINLRKREWVELYVSDAKSFHPVMRIELEKTDIQDYELSAENQNSSSEIREMRILQTSTNGLLDIEVSYANSQNGTIVEQSRDVFAFNGQ